MPTSRSEETRNKNTCYAPTRVTLRTGPYTACSVPVIAYIVHPPNAPAAGCPTVSTRLRLECQTSVGSHWFSCDRAYLDDAHQMVVVGLDACTWRFWQWPEITSKVC